jgi:AcrR family transcriptional regulator
MARTQDQTVTDAITRATLEQLNRNGFAGMSIGSVAEAAGVGKPAIYRRFESKADLVAAVVSTQLAEMVVPDLGDSRAELWHAMSHGFPADGDAYVSLIGGFMAESQRHPELIEAFRIHVLLPRRATVLGLIERGQRRGEIRRDIPGVAALDLLAGPLLARVFAGDPTGPSWRKQSFAVWWDLVRERPDQ